MWKYALTLLPIPVQLLIALGMYWRKLHLKYPVFWSYIWFESARATLIVSLAGSTGSPFYFIAYWGLGFLSTIFILAVLREVFVKLLADYSALTRLRCRGYEVCLAIACFTAVGTSTLIPGRTFFSHEIIRVQQTVSLVAVAMLIFVGAASVTLGIRWRAELCGIAAGLGLQGVVDALVFTGTLQQGSYRPALIGWIETITYDFSFIVFALYFLVPQEESAPPPPVRKDAAEWVESMSGTLSR